MGNQCIFTLRNSILSQRNS